MSTTTLQREKNKTLVPQLRFQEFDGEWNKSNLGQAFTIFNGYAFASSSSVEDGVLWVKIADVGIQEMKKNNLSYLPISLKEKHKKFILIKGDFVVALTRPILNGKLKIAQINSFFDGALLNQRVGKIVSNNSHYFIYSLLQKDELIKSIENNIAGSDPPNLSPNEINSIEISYPPLPEQQKIASFLSAVDEKIQQLYRKKELLEQYKKGVMQQLFSGKLRFKDENGEWYPDWEEKKFKEIVLEYRLGGNYTNTLEITEYPLIKMGNIGRGLVNINKLEYIPIDELIDSKDKIEYGDLFFNTRNTLDLVGKVAIWRNELQSAYYNSNLMYLRFKNNFFMNYRLNSYECIKGLRRFATGTTSVAAIYTKDLLKLKVNMPCIEEQQKIAHFLSGIDGKIEQVNVELVKTQEFKKGLLQQLFV